MQFKFQFIAALALIAAQSYTALGAPIHRHPPTEVTTVTGEHLGSIARRFEPPLEDRHVHAPIEVTNAASGKLVGTLAERILPRQDDHHHKPIAVTNKEGQRVGTLSRRRDVY